MPSVMRWFDDTSESLGENDCRTRNLQIQLNNIEREPDRNNAALDEPEQGIGDVTGSVDDICFTFRHGQEVQA